MRIALINPISKTVDRPAHWWGLFGRTLLEPMETDEDVNFLRLAREISKLGHECDVFVSDVYRPQRTVYGGNSPRVVYLKTVLKWFFPPAYFPLMTGLYRGLKKGRYDVIQSSDIMQPSTFVACFAAKRIFVWQEQDRYSSRWWLKPFQAAYFRLVRLFLARKIVFIPRSGAAKSFLGRMGYPLISEPVPTGVDTAERFYPVPEKEEFILVVSRLASDKGMDFLLRSMALVVKDMPSAKLVIKGDGPYRRHVEETIAKMGLGSNVSLHTKHISQKELNSFYNRAMLTLIPTEGGLFPFAALESMAAGKPVISRFERALKDVVIDGRTGYIVKNEEEMAARVLSLLRDEAERKRMGLEALSLVRSYGMPVVAKRFAELYRSYLTGPSHG